MSDLAAAAPVPAAHSRLEHVPVGMFAIVMGLAGLTLATMRLEHVGGMHTIAPDLLLGLTGLAFAAIAVLYGAKAVKYPKAVRADWNHPVRIAFFPAASISLILIATALTPMHACDDPMRTSVTCSETPWPVKCQSDAISSQVLPSFVPNEREKRR